MFSCFIKQLKHIMRRRLAKEKKNEERERGEGEGQDDDCSGGSVLSEFILIIKSDI